MARFGKVSGNVKGKLNFLDQCTFAQGVAGAGVQVIKDSNIWYVDGSKTDPAASGEGKTWAGAFLTIAEAIAAAGRMDTIYVAAKNITDYTGDPTSYEETLIIPNTHDGLQLIGVSRGPTQGGLPQVKIGAGSTAMLTIRAAGCLIANMGFNGASSTGGGILLDDDYAAKCAFGTTITGCHFKNCVVTTEHAETGGAIYTTSAGNCWQVLISGNRFYKNEGDIILVGTSNTVPQDWIIENNIFSGPAANVDCNIYTGGSGINGLIIRDNIFTAIPAIGSGANAAFLVLTGSVGIMSGNMFAASVAEGGTERTFGATGDELVPVTMFMAGNYGEFSVGVGAGLVSGEIFRT